MAHKILVVDDDPTQRRLLEAVIERLGYTVVQAESGAAAIDLLESAAGSEIKLVMLDLVMPEMNGMAVMERVAPSRPDLPIIVLTAQGGVDTAVSAMRAGALDFFIKPASPERIKVGIENALKRSTLEGEVQRLVKHRSGHLSFDDLIAESPAMRQVIRLGERAAKSNIPILIEGESGVGKELIARAIQGQSERAGKPFITVNCGAIPANLVESLLFGHEKGSFTGASAKHIGKFQEAHGGTLFLDEIGELPLDMQVKLLRALQEGEVDPVGSKKPVKVDIRLISATNKDLVQLAQTGEFREDLYYRLNVFPIAVPPLRERMEDVPILVQHFIDRFAIEEKKSVSTATADALDLLKSHSWPGNVRQLENTVFRAVVLTDGDHLSFADFPQISAAMGVEVPVTSAPPGPAPKVQGAPAQEGAAAHGNAAPMNGAISAVGPSGHLRRLEDIEGEMIQLAIDTYSGHMSEVARRLGIGRSTLYRKVRELGLDHKRAS